MILVGRRNDFSPEERELWAKQQGPDTIKIEIRQILKGDLRKGEIMTVNSWDGMCPYGINVDDGEYILFLTKRKTIWDTVNYGCSEKILPVRDGRVILKDTTLTIAEFTNKYLR